MPCRCVVFFAGNGNVNRRVIRGGLFLKDLPKFRLIIMRKQNIVMFEHGVFSLYTPQENEPGNRWFHKHNRPRGQIAIENQH